MSAIRPLLVIGWSGADWHSVQQALDEDRLPALAKLIDEGASGPLSGVVSPSTAVNWTSLATGLRASRHGVTGTMQLRPDRGGVQSVGKQSWRAPSFWETIAATGRSIATIGWPATRPADRWPGVVIDDSFAVAGASPPNDWPMPPHAVSPQSLRPALAPLRIHPREIVMEQLLHFFPDLATLDQKLDKRPLRVARAVAETASLHAAVTQVLAEDSCDVCAIYYPLLGQIVRSIGWEEFIIAAAYQFLDMMLARVIELAGSDVDVVVMAPGGSRPSTDRSEIFQDMAPGFVVAQGASIRRDSLVHGASIFDVCPTVLAMVGLKTRGAGDGRILSEMFIDQPSLAEVEVISTDSRAGDDDAYSALSDSPLSPAAAQLITEMKFTSHIVTGEAYLSSGNTKAALVQFEAALAMKGDNYGVMLRQAQCYLRLADRSRLRDIAAKLYAQQPQSPWSQMAMGAAKRFFREPDAAAYFDEAGRIGRDRPEVQLWLGEIAFRLNQLAKAEQHYKAALELRSDLAPAFANLGVVKLLRGQPAEAERHLRSALGLRYNWPEVHRHLGIALRRQGYGEKGDAAFRIAQAQSGLMVKISMTPALTPIV